MSLRNWKTVVGALAAAGIVGCGPEVAPQDHGDVTGVAEVAQALPALASAPTFATGTLTVTLASGEVAVIAKHAVSGNITVNDVVTTGATSAAVKIVDITGAAGAETVIIDFANGTFAPGTSTSAGIVADMGGGADKFKVRGAGAAADTITLGGTSTAAVIATNVDAYDDITVDNAAAVAFTFSLGGGNDVFNALSGAYGTGGAAYTGDVTVYGGVGDDTLTGGDGDDTLYGDLGNDTINGGTAADADVVFCGAGTDTVTYAARSAAVTVTVGSAATGETGETDDLDPDCDIVRTGSGNDTINASQGNQTYYGGAGDDTFLMGATAAGNDVIYGEAGTDTVSYAARSVAVTVTMDLNVANDGESGSETDNVRDDVENFVCPTAAVVCTVTGNASNNTITGGAGADVLSGGTGDDTFVMGANGTIGAGADTLAGGAGLDRVTFASFGAVINVTMDGVASTTMSKVIGSDVENLTCPSASACTVTGNALANHIIGSSAVDTISVAGGDDLVETGGGNDVVDCGDGSDILYYTAGTPVPTACEL